MRRDGIEIPACQKKKRADLRQPFRGFRLEGRRTYLAAEAAAAGAAVFLCLAAWCCFLAVAEAAVSAAGAAAPCANETAAKAERAAAAMRDLVMVRMFPVLRVCRGGS